MIVIYGILVMLAFRNIWAILVKQQEYKNLPILMYYVFAIIAVFLRLIIIIWNWSSNPLLSRLDSVQQVAKLCVGVVQDWITLELAIRIQNAKGDSDISEAAKKQLRQIRLVLFILLALGFIAFSLIASFSSNGYEDDESTFWYNNCSMYDVVGYLFLC